MKTNSLLIAVTLLGGACFTAGHAADPSPNDKAKTIIYRAETPNKVWDGWGNASPPDPHPEKAGPAPFEQFEVIDRKGAELRTFAGKVVVDGPTDGVQIGLVSLVGIHWNLADAYQWEPVSADGTFCITDKNYPDASKALVVRGPNTAWTFLHYNFTPKQAGRDIVLTADPSKHVRLTASGADMADLDKVGYEPFHAVTQLDAQGNALRRQRYDYLKSGDEKYVDTVLPVGQIAIFVHRSGYADFYQVVDTTKADHIHFVLRKAGRMKITVLDADGNPKANVPVNWVNPAAPLSLWAAKTNEAGLVAPDHLVPGTFELNVQGFPHSQVDVQENKVTELVYQDGKTPDAPVFKDVPAKPPEPKPATK